MNDKTILIVDDNPTNLEILIQLLEDAGYQVRPADSGKMALIALEHGSIDLILLDIRMPIMDGYEVCRILKENPRTCDIPVIFISALHDPQDKVKAFESGGVDYVTKPFNSQEVLARVKTHLQLHALQQRMERYNQELETEVERRTASLIESNSGLEKALAVKKEFLMLMNHEFRTPLNGILGTVSMLSNELEGELREYSEIIEKSGWRLLKLVDDILQVAQEGNADLSRGSQHAPLDIESLCDASLQSVANLAAGKQITTNLTTENMPRLETPINPSRLRQIIANLLDNALKFTPTGGHIGIQASYAEDARQLSIEVWDTGPGIPATDRERIFKPFEQLDPILSRGHEGAGLGLTLARNLAELHGGSIMLTDREGGGSVFYLILPAQTAADYRIPD